MFVPLTGRDVVPEMHWMNPQYRLSLQEVEEDEGGMACCLVELSQKDRRQIRHKAMNTVHIGFVLYEVRTCIPQSPKNMQKTYRNKETHISHGISVKICIRNMSTCTFYIYHYILGWDHSDFPAWNKSFNVTLEVGDAWNCSCSNSLKKKVPIIID